MKLRSTRFKKDFLSLWIAIKEQAKHLQEWSVIPSGSTVYQLQTVVAKASTTEATWAAQAHIRKTIPLATYSPCACHSLNMCDVHATECCPEVITFFGVVQKLYNVFISSPHRWEILKENVGCSLHSISDTRWTARVDSAKLFAVHLPGIKKAIEIVLDLNLTAETRLDLNGIQTYVN